MTKIKPTGHTICCPLNWKLAYKQQEMRASVEDCYVALGPQVLAV